MPTVRSARAGHRVTSTIHGVDTRRKHNAPERRRLLCDAAIALLAEDGPHGLSHLKVDHRAGVPAGTTSFYYRTRAALLHGVADQLTRYDAEAFTQACKDVTHGSDAAIAGTLADQILSVRTEPQQSRMRARLALTMPARRDADLATGFQQLDERFRALAERAVIATQTAGGAPLDRALCDEQASVLLAFLGGLAVSFLNGSPRQVSRDDLRRQIRAVIIGVAAERESTGEGRRAQIPVTQ